MITEPIELAIDMTGVWLVFADFQVKGLPNFYLDTIYNGDYKVEKQDFRFLISSKSVADNAITKGQDFTFIDGTYNFTFRITNIPAFDLTGFAEFQASFLSKEILV